MHFGGRTTRWPGRRAKNNIGAEFAAVREVKRLDCTLLEKVRHEKVRNSYEVFHLRLAAGGET